MFETFALQIPLKGPIFILKKELLKIPLFGWYLKKIGAIEIIRETTTKRKFKFFDKINLQIKKREQATINFPSRNKSKAIRTSSI